MLFAKISKNVVKKKVAQKDYLYILKSLFSIQDVPQNQDKPAFSSKQNPLHIPVLSTSVRKMP